MERSVSPVADSPRGCPAALEALPSELNVVPPQSVDRIQASADERRGLSCRPENRQEGRARLTRHKKYLDGLRSQNVCDRSAELMEMGVLVTLGSLYLKVLSYLTSFFAL